MFIAASTTASPATAPMARHEFVPSCSAGEKAVSFRAGWAEKSDAICAYDFAEFNRRLSAIIEAPAGIFTPEYFAALFKAPPAEPRPGFEPNSFYSVNAGHSQILAGEWGWDVLITHYHTRSESKMGRKDQVTVQFRPAYITPFKFDDPKSSGCLTQSEIVDRALAAGWQYEIRQMRSERGSQRAWFYGLLANDGGRTLTLAGLSVEGALLAPRKKLEATCAVILEFAETRVTQSR